MPSCAKANGMVFPIVPPQLLLSPLEERLVSPRIPFMQLRELPRGGQLSITGNIVNAPANINTTVQVLPRTFNDLATVPIKLKRKLAFKHHYTLKTIRPNKVIDGVKWLLQNSTLYQDEGLTLDEDWLSKHNAHDHDMSAFVSSSKELHSNVRNFIFFIILTHH